MFHFKVLLFQESKSIKKNGEFGMMNIEFVQKAGKIGMHSRKETLT